MLKKLRYLLPLKVFDTSMRRISLKIPFLFLPYIYRLFLIIFDDIYQSHLFYTVTQIFCYVQCWIFKYHETISFPQKAAIDSPIARNGPKAN